MDDTILEIVFTSILCAILACGFVILYMKYRQTNHKIILLLALFFLCSTFESVFQAAESITDFVTSGWIGWYYLFGKWMIVFRTLIIIAFFEYMARDSIRKGFIAYWASLSGIVVVLDIIWMWIDSNYAPVFYFVEMLVDKPSDWAYYCLVLSFLFGVYTTYQIRKNAPSSLKKQSTWFLSGFIITAIALAIFELERIVSSELPSTAFVEFLRLLVTSEVKYASAGFLGIGVIIISVVLVKNTRIAYILPLKVLRLSVVDIKTGFAYYSHTWETGREFVDEDIYTGMLQGIRCVIQESMNQGDLKEIKTESATILLSKQKGFRALFFLATKVPTNVLRNVLDIFSRDFCAQFGQLFGDDVVSSDGFRKADSLVEKLFPYR